MKFCPDCGAPLERRIPEGDERARAVCTVCGTVHYQNPRVVVGCVPEWQGAILLCRRAIEPRRGFWTAPAGFLEIGESLHTCAARETAEEALAEVSVGSLLSVVNVLYAAQVHVMFRAQMRSAAHGAGLESLETRLCQEQDVPWDEIAFSSIHYSLQRYFADRRAGVAGLHFHDLAVPIRFSGPTGPPEAA